MQPVWNEPALTFDTKREGERRRYVAASELHIGVEGDLARRGAFLLSRSLDMADRLLKIKKDARAHRLLLLGDIKHRIAFTSRQETRDVPRVFERLADFEEVHITLGNHDPGLAKLLPKKSFPNLRIHPATGVVIKGDEGSVGGCHGHAWPKASVATADTLLIGHTHAAVSVVDQHGTRMNEWAWVRGRLDAAKVKAKYGRAASPRVVVFPPFNPLLGGTAVNHHGFLGPLGALIDRASIDVHLLDGRALGHVDVPAHKSKTRAASSRET